MYCRYEDQTDRGAPVMATGPASAAVPVPRAPEAVAAVPPAVAAPVQPAAVRRVQVSAPEPLEEIEELEDNWEVGVLQRAEMRRRRGNLRQSQETPSPNITPPIENLVNPSPPRTSSPISVNSDISSNLDFFELFGNYGNHDINLNVSDYLSENDIDNLLQESPDDYLKDYSISEDWDPYAE